MVGRDVTAGQRRKPLARNQSHMTPHQLRHQWIWRTTTVKFKAACKAQALPCHICHQPIDYTLAPQRPHAFETDHRIPLIVRPDLAYAWANLAPSHSRCNRARQAKLASGQGMLNSHNPHMPHTPTGWAKPEW